MNFRDGQDELLLVGFHEEREQRLYVCERFKGLGRGEMSIGRRSGYKGGLHKRRHRAASPKLCHTGGYQPSHMNFVHPPD